VDAFRRVEAVVGKSWERRLPACFDSANIGVKRTLTLD